MSKDKKHLRAVNQECVKGEAKPEDIRKEQPKEEPVGPHYMRKEYLERVFVLPEMSGREINILRQALLRLVQTQSEVNAWESINDIFIIKQKIDLVK